MSAVEKQIGTYLSLLNAQQKKAVLTVVKKIAAAQQDYGNIWEDKDFVKEIDRRTAEYENGTAKLNKFEENKERRNFQLHRIETRIVLMKRIYTNKKSFPICFIRFISVSIKILFMRSLSERGFKKIKRIEWI